MKIRLMLGLLFSTTLFYGCAKKCEIDCSNVVKEKYVHKYGVEVCESDWQSRGMNGQVISTLDDGVIVTKQYIQGKLDGNVSYTYPHSNKIERIETYKSNRLIKTVHNDEQGVPESEIHHSPDGNEVVSSWYSSGNPKSKEFYEGTLLYNAEYFSPSNQLEAKIENGDGIKVCRACNGDLVANEEYKNGIINCRTEYYQTGPIKSTAFYNEDATRCEKRKFHATGEPKEIEQWVNGRQHGVSVIFRNGEKYAEVPYSRGAKNGVERRYRDGNILIEEISWVNDKMHGPSYTFIDGTVSKTTWYYQGNAVEKSEYDSKTMKKKSKAFS